MINIRHEYGGFGREVNVKVEERRASTDESVRILREMEEAARRSVVWAFEPKDNVLDVMAIGMEHGLIQSSDGGMFFGQKIYIVFTLNGEKFTITPVVDTQGMPIRDFRKDQILRVVVKAVADEITNKLVDRLAGELK